MIVRPLLVCALAALFAVPSFPAAHKNEDPLYTQAKAAEVRKDWDAALELYVKAVHNDPGNIAVQLGLRRVQFQAAQMHVDLGRKLRNDGKLQEALDEFTRACAIDPSLMIAEQELRRTRSIIDGGQIETPKEADDRRMDAMQGPPQLRALNQQRIKLVISNQPPRILFETIASLAGINVVFDPEYPGPSRNSSATFHNVTLEEALDSLTLQTKSFWKAIGENTIFVTMDNPAKRRDYEDMLVKTIYLQNITSLQELQEIATAVRAVTEVRRLFTFNGQNAVILRGTVRPGGARDKADSRPG
ncbi:MAG: hypothetical protein HY820_23920 [Acidobacteria bacterium]|nr:hypothetical protein [Acidobacteriota bacterium]